MPCFWPGFALYIVTLGLGWDDVSVLDVYWRVARNSINLSQIIQRQRWTLLRLTQLDDFGLDDLLFYKVQ